MTVHLKQIGTIDTFTFAIMEEEEGQTNGRIVSHVFLIRRLAS